MATVNDFYNAVNSAADFSSQEEWDNSGLLIGDPECEVTAAVVTLDVTPEVIDFAVNAGANLIISHHPVIFRPIKSVVKGGIPFELASKSINAICCHTPLDIACGGTNDALAKLLNIPVEVGDNPIIRIGRIDKKSADEFAAYISEKLGAHIRYADAGKSIETVAICTGSGCSLLGEFEADAFITGDASHHDFLDFLEKGISLFAAGHFETENPVVDTLISRLKESFPDVRIINSSEKNPIRYI